MPDKKKQKIGSPKPEWPQERAEKSLTHERPEPEIGPPATFLVMEQTSGTSTDSSESQSQSEKDE